MPAEMSGMRSLLVEGRRSRTSNPYLYLKYYGSPKTLEHVRQCSPSWSCPTENYLKYSGRPQEQCMLTCLGRVMKAVVSVRPKWSHRLMFWSLLCINFLESCKHATQTSTDAKLCENEMVQACCHNDSSEAPSMDGRSSSFSFSRKHAVLAR